ncbi:Alpha/Beta hydrolase protein [Biscogniauxia sp. FL1348]|nr:Alpha/Beta hydrolase protein [Biscogniauxia sp. FL1348]
MTSPSASPLPTVEEVVKSEAFPTTIWQLEPHRSGLLPVAAGRGGPLNISWEVHGDGPIKLIFICGLGFLKTSYQRQTLYFGHVHSSRYSVLLLDNRGMGGSSKPLMRYSTSAMAADLLEVVAHLGWASTPRSLHLCGISMGGMIAQEVAWAAPELVASLSLVCTAAAIEDRALHPEITLLAHLTKRVAMLRPKGLDDAVRYAASTIFPAGFLDQPDNATLPDAATTPRCRIPEGGYRMFESNYARFAAQEITKQRDPSGAFTRTGFLMQLVAAGWHNKSPEQLRQLADQVGRERILVMHGTDDNMISPPHGRKLIDCLQPGKGLLVEGMGHAPIMERTEWFNECIEEMCELGERLSGR